MESAWMRHQLFGNQAPLLVLNAPAHTLPLQLPLVPSRQRYDRPKDQGNVDSNHVPLSLTSPSPSIGLFPFRSRSCGTARTPFATGRGVHMCVTPPSPFDNDSPPPMPLTPPRFSGLESCDEASLFFESPTTGLISPHSANAPSPPPPPLVQVPRDSLPDFSVTSPALTTQPVKFHANPPLPTFNPLYAGSHQIRTPPGRRQMRTGLAQESPIRVSTVSSYKFHDQPRLRAEPLILPDPDNGSFRDNRSYVPSHTEPDSSLKPRTRQLLQKAWDAELNMDPLSQTWRDTHSQHTTHSTHTTHIAQNMHTHTNHTHPHVTHTSMRTCNGQTQRGERTEMGEHGQGECRKPPTRAQDRRELEGQKKAADTASSDEDIADFVSAVTLNSPARRRTSARPSRTSRAQPKRFSLYEVSGVRGREKEQRQKPQLPSKKQAKQTSKPLCKKGRMAAKGKARSPSASKSNGKKFPSNRKKRRCLWTPLEDENLIAQVATHGPRHWSVIAAKMGTSDNPERTGKQCRERWHNHLDPAIKKGSWTREEDRTLISAHQSGRVAAGQWAEIAKELPGRSDNAVKNRWNLAMTRALRFLENPKDRNSPKMGPYKHRAKKGGVLFSHCVSIVTSRADASSRKRKRLRALSLPDGPIDGREEGEGGRRRDLGGGHHPRAQRLFVTAEDEDGSANAADSTSPESTANPSPIFGPAAACSGHVSLVDLTSDMPSIPAHVLSLPGSLNKLNHGINQGDQVGPWFSQERQGWLDM